jgi:hypothetical protein
MDVILTFAFVALVIFGLAGTGTTGTVNRNRVRQVYNPFGATNQWRLS